MKIAVFAKKAKSNDGRSFIRYLGKLQKKTGEEITCTIKFREECGSPNPASCPCYITVIKKDANLARRTYTDPRTGDVGESFTLWVNAWALSADRFVDTSLDEFED